VDLTCQLLLHAAAPFVEDEGLFNTITLSPHPGNASGTSVPGGGLERSTSSGPSRDKLTLLEKLSLETQNFQVNRRIFAGTATGTCYFSSLSVYYGEDTWLLRTNQELV